MRKPLAIVNARATSNIDKQVVWYNLTEHDTPCELPYILRLYNKQNYCIYIGAFHSKESAITYAQDRIDMTTPIF